MNTKYYSLLRFIYNNDFLHVEDHFGYESRNSSIIKLVKSAWELYLKNSNDPEKIKYFSLYTDDIFNPSLDYSFAITGKEYLDKCMPNFVFDSWPECGIQDYESTFDKMVEMGSMPFEDRRVFWIGAVEHLIDPTPRLMGSEVSKKNSDLFDFRFVQWKQRGLEQWKYTEGYVSILDHCKYRVLIDFGGAGFSARIPLLLASGRPVILVGHPQEAWFYWDGSLVPWKHYIPCGSHDGKDLKEEDIEKVIKWTFKNIESCEEIGKSGQEYAKKYLSKDAVLKKIADVMTKNKNVLN